MKCNVGPYRIVGRETELENLYSSISDVINGRSRHCIISGEAGIGKSTLIEEVERTTKRLDFIVLRGVCMPGYGYANQPFMDIINLIKPVLRTLHFGMDEQDDVRHYERTIDSIINLGPADDPFLHRPEGLLFLYLDLVKMIGKKDRS